MKISILTIVVFVAASTTTGVCAQNGDGGIAVYRDVDGSAVVSRNGGVSGAATRDGGERKFIFSTSLGMGVPLDGYSETPLTWQVSGLRRLSDRWAVGVGTGLSFYGKTLLPVFGDIRYQIGRQRRFTPYTELVAGYSFALSGGANGSMLLSTSVGVTYPLSTRLKLQLGVGCEMQGLERLRTSSDSYFIRSFTEKVNRNTLSVRLGVLF